MLFRTCHDDEGTRIYHERATSVATLIESTGGGLSDFAPPGTLRLGCAAKCQRRTRAARPHTRRSARATTRSTTSGPKLLGLLPIATGTGVFLLLNGNDSGTASDRVQDFLFAIGLLGFAFTLGLYSFELYGIKRCHYLIRTGQRLEKELRVDGQFLNRPHELMGFVYEPLASGFIYSASMAAWLFLLVACSSRTWQIAVPAVTFAVGLIFTLTVAKAIDRADRNRQTVQAAVSRRPTTTVDSLAAALGLTPRTVRSALRVSASVKADAAAATALARMDDWGWLTVLDGGRPLGTVGEDDLKRAASDAKVDEVLDTTAR